MHIPWAHLCVRMQKLSIRKCAVVFDLTLKEIVSFSIVWELESNLAASDEQHSRTGLRVPWWNLRKIGTETKTVNWRLDPVVQGKSREA